VVVDGRRRLLLGMLSLMLGAPLSSQAAEPNTTVIIKILLRTLTFDRSFGEELGDEIGVAVLYDGKSPASQREMHLIMGELMKASRVRIAGRTMKARSIDCTNEAEVAEAAKMNVMFLVQELSAPTLERMLIVSRKHQIPTLSTSRMQVERGAAIGAVLDNEKPRLLINLPASKAAGMVLSAHMLRMAEVIR
jgi:hypothetical protein